MRIAIVFFLFLGFLSESWAKSSQDLLKTVWSDPRLKLHKESRNLVVSAKSLNPLDKADLRIDRGQLEQDDIKYALRFYPKGLTEHRTTQEFQRTLEKNEETAYMVTLSQLLAAQYDLLARIALNKSKIKIRQSLADLNKKSGSALSYSAQRDRNEIKSYLKNKSDLVKSQIESTDINRDYELLQAELQKKDLGSIESIDLDDFAGIDIIEERINKISKATETQTLSAKLAEQELQTSRAEMDYDRAKDEKWFDHVEISISDVRKETVYGFEFAFNLPFASAPNLSRVGKEARELREKAKLIALLKPQIKFFKTRFMN